ncbi:alkene reductase [Zoogloea sp.]|uniref:alkene reductase n=1 Tax=Zoogloea sp. TaxID=49181 RepID=UPI0035AE9CFC
MNAPLFQPLAVGDLRLPNRIVMPPLTRARAAQPGNVPTAMNAAYYAARAYAGLIVAEATDISPDAKGYSLTPGIHSRAQIEGWQHVTEAVHRRGGRIFLQIWHCGRMSHPDFHAGALPVAPSALPFSGQIWKAGPDGRGGMVPCPPPRALDATEITAIVADFRQAARNAIEAGFDGVEIHAANGYLIDQFLRSSANQRSDAYGGSRDKRLRFLLEVTDAVTGAIGAARTGVRLSPRNLANGMDCPDSLPTAVAAATQLAARGVAYLHINEPGDDSPEAIDARRQLRAAFPGPLIVAGGYTLARAEAVLKGGEADLVAFGRPYIANPDLAERLQHGWPLNAPDATTFFGGDARGYLDYPTHPTTEAEPA